MNEETMKRIEQCHLILNRIEREMQYLREENHDLKIENEKLKKEIKALVELNKIYVTKK